MSRVFAPNSLEEETWQTNRDPTLTTASSRTNSFAWQRPNRASRKGQGRSVASEKNSQPTRSRRRVPDGGRWTAEHIAAELGELPIRGNDREITVFKSLGLAVEDLFAAQDSLNSSWHIRLADLFEERH